MRDVELRRLIHEGMPRAIEELSRLIAIPSVSHAGYDTAHVRASAELTARILEDAGVTQVRLLELDGGHPAVHGEIPGPPHAPTVLLYAHHDVQPAADAAVWTSPPFEPEVRQGRLYGRGAADDKSGIVLHAAALRALLADGPLPCTVKVLVEGEEESSAAHLPELVLGNADLLRADVAVIADGGNHRTGVPTLGTSIRGSTSIEVRVDVLPQPVHSGAFGGPLPDAITALSHIIASLHDGRGDVAIEGLRRWAWDGAQVTEDELREESGLYPEVELIGSGSIAERTLSGPAVNVLAFEAPRVEETANQIVASARAVIGLRLAPGEDVERAQRLLAEHVRANAPWGVRVTVLPDEPSAGYVVNRTAPAFAAAGRAMESAFGMKPVSMGSGGSIPLVPVLVEAIPDIQILIWGAGDDRSNYHSTDESVDLADLETMALVEASFLRDLGG